MGNTIYLKTIFPNEGGTNNQQISLFALINLGVLESLMNGLLSAADALRVFFHAENCLFVRRHIRTRIADEIMSRGVQLSDLFDALPATEAQREFQHELATMRALCLSLLEEKQLAA